MSFDQNTMIIWGYLILILIFYFTWYYVTLPGSMLSFNKNKYSKVSIKDAFKQYFGLYYIPMYIGIIYYLYKINNISKDFNKMSTLTTAINTIHKTLYS